MFLPHKVAVELLKKSVSRPEIATSACRPPRNDGKQQCFRVIARSDPWERHGNLDFFNSFAVGFFLLLGALAVGCSRPSEEIIRGETMGTTYTVKVATQPFSEQRQKVAGLSKAVQERLDAVDQKMSTYKPDSELSRFNEYRGTDPFQVSTDTFQVFEYSRRVSEESGGAFDVTVGPLVNAWGFGPEKRRPHAPSDEEIATLRTRVGYQKVELDPTACTLRKTQPDIYCDLSAVAKGYGVDKVAALLEETGFQDYMVEVGGEVRVKGRNARGVPWQIAIEKPLAGARAIELVVPLDDLSMATSGDYRNYYEENGVRLSHEIDPATGRPIAHNLASVSVIHQECALADAYATALMVLGPERGYALAEKLDLAAFFILREAPNQFSEKVSPAFEKVMSVCRM